MLLKAVTVALLYAVSTSLLHARAKVHFRDPLNEKILDLGFELLPDLTDYELFVDALDVILILGTFYLVPSSSKVPFLWEYFEKFLLLIAIRSVTTHLTVFPQTKKCSNQELGFLTYARGHCWDFFFSGHASVIFLWTAMLITKGYASGAVALGVIACNALVAILIVASKAHYSCDVVMALFVTYFVNSLG